MTWKNKYEIPNNLGQQTADLLPLCAGFEKIALS